VRVAIITTGICESAYAPNRWGTGEVLFADRDAEAIHALFAGSFEKSELVASHSLLNKQATYNEVESAFKNVGSVGTIDLLVVFFAGHGVKDRTRADGSTFCLVDGSPEQPGLGANDLGRMLNLTSAGATLVLADCCFAEGLFTWCDFFHQRRGNAMSRIWLAAASAHEESWEDVDLKHGVLTQEFIDALLRFRNSNPRTASNGIDLTGELLPHLSKQVPLRAAQTSPLREQHPVWGGVIREPILLPTGKSGSSKTIVTPLVAFRRLAKIACVALILICLLFAIFIQTTRYHLVQGANGNIVVRRGTATTDFLTPGRLGILVDTDFGPSSLAGQDSVLAPLRSGSLQGWWLPLNSYGYRAWVTKLQPFLTPEASCRSELYLNGSLSAEWLSLLDTEANPGLDPEPWLTEISSEAVVLGQTSNLPPWRVLLSLPTLLKADSQSTNTKILDFTILDLKSSAIKNYSRAVANVSTVDDHNAFTGLLQLAALVAHRGDNPKQEIDTESEASLLASTTQTIISQRLRLGKEPLSEAEISGFDALMTPGGKMMRLVCLAAAGSHLSKERQTNTQDELIMALDTFDADAQGSVLTKSQAVAAGSIATQIESGGIIQSNIFDSIRKLSPVFGGLLSLPKEMIEILVQASKRNALPNDIEEEFKKDLTKPASELSFGSFPLMKVLVAGANGFDEKAKQKLQNQVERITRELSENDRIMPECVEVLGLLGEIGISDDFALESARRQIRFKDYHDRPPNSEDDGHTIVADDGEAFAVALGRIAEHRILDKATATQLWKSALNRADVAEYESILRGLANQMPGSLKTGASIRSFIASHNASYPERRLATDVVSCGLQNRAPNEINNVQNSLRLECAEEEEPEIRMALQKVIFTISLH
jgi:hypothetical protein